jgi:Flp pilus assembly protein TadG
MKRCKRESRTGAATVELAVLLPLLVFLFVITIDWARVFYYSLTLSNAARQGAMYMCDPIATPWFPYASAEQAALADCTNLSPAPTVTTSTGTDGAGNPFVSVTVNWQFPLVTSYPGISNNLNLSRTCQMRVAPLVPN